MLVIQIQVSLLCNIYFSGNWPFGCKVVSIQVISQYKFKKWNCARILITSSTVCMWTRKTFGVWFSSSWVLNRVYNFTIKHLEQGVFLDWKPFKECEDLQWVAYICNTDNFFLNIYFHDFSVKNYLILYEKQSKSGWESGVSCLKQGGEMRSFCLKQGRGFRPWWHPSTQTSLVCPPPPHSPRAPGLPKGRNLGSFISVWVTHSNTPCTPLEHTSIDNSNIPVGVGTPI